MEKVNCIAVDDEAPALRVVERFCSRIDFLQLKAQFRKPIDASTWMEHSVCQLIFLDISMPQQNGIEWLKSLNRKPLVVFTTAYSEFAASAFDLDAVDYLRKPFSFDRFLKASEKARDHLQIDKLKKSELVTNTVAENFITIKADGDLIRIAHAEIAYVEAFQEYVKIYTENARYITYERMKNMETLLPANLFMRVHRSYIVAINKIRMISGNMVDLGDRLIPISRDMKDELMKRFSFYK
jgi:DNA-binding LytR/AlgR family response regulator